jgi:hypothetical protein
MLNYHFSIIQPLPVSIIMKKKNRALEKMGIGKRANTATPATAEPMLAQSATYQAPHSSTNLERKMKRRHVSNFARQCAEYIQQVLAKRKEAKAARLAGR